MNTVLIAITLKNKGLRENKKKSAQIREICVQKKRIKHPRESVQSVSSAFKKQTIKNPRESV